MSRTLSGLKGVENVYTQHSPLLANIATSVLKGRAKEQQYPFVNQGSVSQRPSKTVIIFIIGGITFEEVAKIAEINEANASSGSRVILGGTFVHNSKSFLAELAQFGNRASGGDRSSSFGR